MEKETKILEKKLLEIRNILLELQSLKIDLQTIVNKEEDYFEEMIKKSQFFHRIYLNYIRLFFIDCQKLIGKKEDFNLISLINFCKTNINRIDWNRDLSLEKLDNLKLQFYSVSEHFDTINNLRNKVYAHNDKNKERFDYKITISNLWTVLEVFQKIFVEINLYFDNTQWIFSILYKNPDEIKKCCKYNLIEKYYHEQLGKPNSNMDFEKIKLIIRN